MDESKQTNQVQVFTNIEVALSAISIYVGASGHLQ